MSFLTPAGVLGKGGECSWETLLNRGRGPGIHTRMSSSFMAHQASHMDPPLKLWVPVKLSREPQAPPPGLCRRKQASSPPERAFRFPACTVRRSKVRNTISLAHALFFFQILYQRVNFQIHREGEEGISPAQLLSRAPQEVS